MQHKRKPGVTLADIADAAGLNVASVSRALRGVAGKVSPETRLRVEQLAQQMGYRPNAAASTLRTGRSNLVGIVVPDLANPLFAPIVQSIGSQLRDRGLLCVVIQTPAAASERRETVLALADRAVSGMVVLAAENDDALLTAAGELGLPTVLVNRESADHRFSCVVNDDRHSVRLAVEHLRGLGHRQIAHLAGPSRSSTGSIRRTAFEAECRRLGVRARVIECEAFTREAGARAAAQLLRAARVPGAWFAANDLIAVGALQVLRDSGLSVPGQLSIVGHNDMPMADMLAPPLTTVHVDVEQMGRQAARQLLGHMDDPELKPSALVLSPRLVVRGSTAPPAGQGPGTMN